jgi:hypothetical protein
LRKEVASLIPETEGYSLEEIEPALLRLQEKATA